MVTNLEKVTGLTCINKIRAMKSVYLTEEEEHCKYNCLENCYDKCVKYKPCKDYYIRIKGLKEYYG